MSEFNAWSFCRDVMSRGANIERSAEAAGWGYEKLSTHLDAAASEEARKLTAELDRVTAERDKLREIVSYWSYCTYHGMRRWCPEKESELLEVYRELGVQPYANSAKGFVVATPT